MTNEKIVGAEELPSALESLTQLHNHIIQAYGIMAQVADLFEEASPVTRIKMRAQIKNSLDFVTSLKAELEMARERY